MGRMGCKEDCSIAVIFQELLITQTWNKCHWIWHTSNPTYMPLKPFQCIFPSQNQQNVKFVPVYWTPPNTKWKKKHQFEQGKCIPKGLKICTDKFFGMPITIHYIRTLCEKYFFSYEGFSEFLTRRFRHNVLKHGVLVEWDARRTTA